MVYACIPTGLSLSPSGASYAAVTLAPRLGCCLLLVGEAVTDVLVSLLPTPLGLATAFAMPLAALPGELAVPEGAPRRPDLSLPEEGAVGDFASGEVTGVAAVGDRTGSVAAATDGSLSFSSFSSSSSRARRSSGGDFGSEPPSDSASTRCERCLPRLLPPVLLPLAGVRLLGVLLLVVLFAGVVLGGVVLAGVTEPANARGLDRFCGLRSAECAGPSAPAGEAAA
mmetsp:Transcript_12648/g.38097  ORF Transcript_12648/g.38097 Transcript_12648/m.38097 type:complete len:226 (+) Transcript_12648:248-925(+)